ncbi:aldehyde dehydrogenase family protein, partial [Brevibacterium sediminis]|uniref:aldehyde dehydrogenase family protein n=1 Tax=Brevibacterium sediminis TaxID=1857024 RepID=UPI003B3BC973
MTTMYRVTDPATGQVAEEFPTATDAEILAALDRSATTFDEWSRTTVAERAAILTRVSEIYAERAEELAEVIRLEMGKSVPEGKGEVQLSSMI